MAALILSIVLSESFLPTNRIIELRGTEMICSQAAVLSFIPVSSLLTNTLVGILRSFSSFSGEEALDKQTKVNTGLCLLHAEQLTQQQGRILPKRLLFLPSNSQITCVHLYA